MENNLKDTIAKALAARESAQAEEAGRRGITTEQLEDSQRAAKGRQDRVEAIMRSGILVAGDDVGLIAGSSFKRTRALEAVTDWAGQADGPRFLILSGGVGAGKTFAAATAIASFGGGVAVRSQNLARRIYPTYADTVAGFERLNLRNSILVLDDLGMEAHRLSTTWVEAFAEFIEQRIMFGRTIITTNLRWPELAKRYGARATDRLKSHATVAELSGKSMRVPRWGLR